MLYKYLFFIIITKIKVYLGYTQTSAEGAEVPDIDDEKEKSSKPCDLSLRVRRYGRLAVRKK